MVQLVEKGNYLFVTNLETNEILSTGKARCEFKQNPDGTFDFVVNDKVIFDNKQANFFVDEVNSPFDSITLIDFYTSNSAFNPASANSIAGIEQNLLDLENNKQDLLVSGTNIKTINGSDILGSGNLALPIEIQLACSDETTALTTGNNKVIFRTPCAMTINEVRASLSTAQTSGNILTIDVNENGTSILSTKLTIDNTEKTSTTALNLPVLSDTSFANDSEISVDVDQIGDGTAKGLKVTIIGTRL